MPQCQIKSASPHAFPRGPASIEDRRMSLEANCRESASYSAKLLSTSGDRSRKGAVAQEFGLCENHAQLVGQIDRELMEEGWSTAFAERPRPLL